MVSSTSLKLKVYLNFLGLSRNNIHIFSLETLFPFPWNVNGTIGEEVILQYLHSIFSPSRYVSRHSKLRQMPLSG